jgi:hypothetical protein
MPHPRHRELLERCIRLAHHLNKLEVVQSLVEEWKAALGKTDADVRRLQRRKWFMSEVTFTLQQFFDLSFFIVCSNDHMSPRVYNLLVSLVDLYHLMDPNGEGGLLERVMVKCGFEFVRSDTQKKLAVANTIQVLGSQAVLPESVQHILRMRQGFHQNAEALCVEDVDRSFWASIMRDTHMNPVHAKQLWHPSFRQRVLNFHSAFPQVAAAYVARYCGVATRSQQSQIATPPPAKQQVQRVLTVHGIVDVPLQNQVHQPRSDPAANSVGIMSNQTSMVEFLLRVAGTMRMNDHIMFPQDARSVVQLYGQRRPDS